MGELKIFGLLMMIGVVGYIFKIHELEHVELSWLTDLNLILANWFNNQQTSTLLLTLKLCSNNFYAFHSLYIWSILVYICFISYFYLKGLGHSKQPNGMLTPFKHQERKWHELFDHLANPCISSSMPNSLHKCFIVRKNYHNMIFK